MSNRNQPRNTRAFAPATPADFVIATHDHQVIIWEGLTILSALPVEHDPDWTKYMPLYVLVKEDKHSYVIWERDFNRQSYPYLAMVDGAMVVAYLREGLLVKVDSLRALRDLPDGETLPVAEMVALKEATAMVVGFPPKFTHTEADWIAAQDAPAAPAAAPAAAQPAPLVLRDVSSAPAEAAAVKAPAPVATPATTEAGDPNIAARREHVAARDQRTVYSVEDGSSRSGIPVGTKEFKFLTVGVEYVEISGKGKSVRHFRCVRTEGCPYDQHTQVTDTPPAHVIGATATDGNAVQQATLH